MKKLIALLLIVCGTYVASYADKPLKQKNDNSKQNEKHESSNKNERTLKTSATQFNITEGTDDSKGKKKRHRNSRNTMSIGIGYYQSNANLKIPDLYSSIVDSIIKDAYDKGWNDAFDEIEIREETRLRQYEYYLNVSKRYGWFTGIGKPLTKEEIKHIPVFYRLSRKNEKGHWTVMQAYNAYGNLTTNHSIGTYLVNPDDEYDEFVNRDMLAKLKTVCQWVFVEDVYNDKVAQEYGLDANNNIIYCYAPQKVNNQERTFTGSYTDGNGMPIVMRTDSLGNREGQANYVQVTWNDKGCETLLTFVDEFGNPQKNRDGAYMTRSVFDANGVEIRQASLNLHGKQMNDLCGNCGWENTADAYGNVLTAHYFDADNNPVRMPGTRGSNQVYGYDLDYDKYHRRECLYYLNEEYKRDTNEFGAYKCVTKYNDKGDVILVKYLDKNGKLVIGDSSGVAMFQYEFDSNGNLLSMYFFDENEYLTNSKAVDSLCAIECTYFRDGKQRSRVEYSIVDGAKREMYRSESDSLGNTVNIWYSDNLIRVDSVDDKGQNRLIAFYDLDWNPSSYSGYHRHITEWYDTTNIGGYLEEWRDTEGNLARDNDNDYSYINVTVDSLKKTRHVEKRLFEYLKNKSVLLYSPDYSTIDAQFDLTPYGEHARVGWDNVLYYKANVSRNMYGDISSFVGENEFGEPAYLTELYSEPDVYYFTTQRGNETVYHDENGDVIDSMDVFIRTLPRVLCVEVTDTAIAYGFGLRNGDVILSYGDWNIDDSLKNVNNYYLETVLKAGSAKRMVVVRHYPEEKESRIHVIELPVGTPSDLGFYAHKIYYTKKETDRLLSCASNNGIVLEKYKEKYPNAVMMVPTKGSLLSTTPYWVYNVKNPAIVISAFDKISENDDRILPNTLDKWDISSDDVDSWLSHSMFLEGWNGYKTLYFTDDLDSVKSHTIEGKENKGMRIIPVYISGNSKKAVERLVDSSLRFETYPFEYDPSKRGRLDIGGLIDKMTKLDGGIGFVLKKSSPEWKEARQVFPSLENVNSFAVWNVDIEKIGEMRELLADFNFYNYRTMTNNIINFGGVRLLIGRTSVKDGQEYLDRLIGIDGRDIIVLDGHINTKVSNDFIHELMGYCYAMRDSLYTQIVQIEVVDDGHFRDMGIDGKAILLGYNSWNEGDDIEELDDLINKTREDAHIVTFVPFTEHNGVIKFGKKRRVECEPGLLGIRFSIRMMKKNILGNKIE